MKLNRQDILFLQNRVAYTRDERAYQKLFLHFHPPLHRFADSMLKNTEVAEEIVSDVMMRIWDLASTLAQVDDLNVYLFTAVKNACLNHLGKRKWETLALNEVMENEITDIGNNPENRMIFTEVERYVENAISTLPPQCQMIFRLIREQGFSHREVAVIAEISQNTIETQMRIALRKIRLSLESYLQGKK